MEKFPPTKKVERAAEVVTRRDALRTGLHLTVLAFAAGAGLGCNEKPKALRCDDTTGLTPPEIETRKVLAYVDHTPEPAKNCANCLQFVAPAAASKCGECKVLKGTVHPEGYCKSWTAKGAPAASSG